MAIASSVPDTECREGIDDSLPPADAALPHEDQPDPVTLCHPSHDGDGLLRWASATFDVVR